MSEKPPKEPEGSGEIKQPAGEHEKPTPVEKEEKTPDGIKFGNQQNQKIFSELPEETKGFFSGIYERAKMNTIDRAKITFNTALLNWHEVRASNIAEKRDGHQNELVAVEQKIKRHEESISKIESGMGSVPENIKKQAEKEREELELRKTSLQNRLELENSRLREQERKKSSYENARKDVLDNVSARIKERLDPIEKALENISAQKETLDSEIGAFIDKRDLFQKRIDEMEKEAESAEFGSVEKLYRQEIKRARKAIKEGEKHIKSRLRTERVLERQFARTDRKADRWRIKQNVFVRLISKESPSRETEPLVMEELTTERKQIVEAETRQRAASGANAEAGTKEKEKEESITPSEYEKVWNSYFGSGLRLGESFMKGFDKKGKFEIPSIEIWLQDYNERVRASGGRAISKKKLVNNIELMRVYLRFQ